MTSSAYMSINLWNRISGSHLKADHNQETDRQAGNSIHIHRVRPRVFIRNVMNSCEIWYSHRNRCLEAMKQIHQEFSRNASTPSVSEAKHIHIAGVEGLSDHTQILPCNKVAVVIVLFNLCQNHSCQGGNSCQQHQKIFHHFVGEERINLHFKNYFLCTRLHTRL